MYDLRLVIRPLRILHIAREYPPSIVGGAGMAIAGLARASAQQGHKVAVLSIHGYDETPVPGPAPSTNGDGWRPVREPCGVEVLRIPRQESMRAGLDFALGWKPDVVHTHYIGDRAQAQSIRQCGGAPIVFTVHSLDRILYEIDPLLFNHREENMLKEEAALRGCDRLIVLTPDARRQLARLLPETRARLRLGSHGIDDCEQARSTAFARKPGCPPTVLYCGRFDANKATQDLLQAVPKVLGRCPQARFVMVGGDSFDPGLARQWRDRWLKAAPAGCRTAVHFTGWLDAGQVAGWYGKADILAVPSWYEMFGMVVLEGMLHGLSVAAADAGGPSEILRHGRTGLLYPPGDVGSLAGALTALIEDPALCRRLGRAAAGEVRRRWLWPRIVEQTLSVYRELTLEKSRAEAGLNRRGRRDFRIETQRIKSAAPRPL